MNSIIVFIYLCFFVQYLNGITIVSRKKENGKLESHCVKTDESETLTWLTPYDESFYKYKSNNSSNLSKPLGLIPGWRIDQGYKYLLGPILDHRWQYFETFISKDNKNVKKNLSEILDDFFEFTFSLRYRRDAEMSFYYNNQLKLRMSFSNDNVTSVFCPDQAINCTNEKLIQNNLQNYNVDSWNHFTIRYNKNNGRYILLLNGKSIQNEYVRHFGLSSLDMKSFEGALWKLHSYNIWVKDVVGKNVIFLNIIPDYNNKLCFSTYFYFVNEITVEIRLGSTIIKNQKFKNERIGWKFVKMEANVQDATKVYSFQLLNYRQNEVIFSNMKYNADCETNINQISMEFDVGQIEQVSCVSLNNPNSSIRMGESVVNSNKSNVCSIDEFGNDCIKCKSVFNTDGCENTLICAETNKCYCQPGHQGKYCETKCDDLKKNVFGSNCVDKCGNCKDNEQCHYVTGHCPNGCKKSYLEPFCNERQYCKDVKRDDVLENIVNGKITFQFKESDDVEKCTNDDYLIKTLDKNNKETNEFNPNSNYVIEFWRNNKFVFKYNITTDELKLGSINEAKTNSNVTSIYLSWTPPDEALGNNLNYSITYRLQPTDDCVESLKHLTNPQTVYVQTEFVNVTNLRPHSTYVFEVQAFNKYVGEVKSIIEKTSSREIPNQESYVIHNISVTANTMSVYLQKNCERIESDVAFRLNLQCFDSWCTNLTKTYGFNQSVLSIDDLKPFTKYTVLIEMATEINFEKTVSMQPKQVKTEPSVPKELRDMEVYSISDTGISLVFDIPYPPTGILEEIQINDEKITWEYCSIWKNRFCSKISTRICDKLTVKLKNMNVPNIKSYSINRDCQEKEPDSPQNLQQNWDEDSNLILTWEHPLRMNGEFDKFIISYANKTVDFVTQENLRYNHKIRAEEICSSEINNLILKVSTKNKKYDAKGTEIHINCPVVQFMDSTATDDDINIFVIIVGNNL
ncbi:PREDICTED: uncharacterized protein LOC108560479 isoform X2 [Nicrophorus vespilloides]|uniref:Uncharacterized protein LOC108560479 isoform X2 n=1 Tax=Nicrophorus vespilloides TaxID=110193 RepID=A0ABM1MG32_NICVS|nr:PREDICTED: uncharacterized protein LOC108560479 isoform X2 [Nicrophorus vespilloides]